MKISIKIKLDITIFVRNRKSEDVDIDDGIFCNKNPRMIYADEILKLPSSKRADDYNAKNAVFGRKFE